MTVCGERLVAVATREWDIGTCEREPDHPMPHELETTTLSGRPVVVRWGDGPDIKVEEIKR